MFNEPYLHLDAVGTDRQAGDIFTKGFTNPEKWKAVCTLIYHIDPEAFWRAPLDEDSVPVLLCRPCHQSCAQSAEKGGTEGATTAQVTVAISPGAEKEKYRRCDDSCWCMVGDVAPALGTGVPEGTPDSALQWQPQKGT